MVQVPYRELAGSLMYLSVVSRPDITYSVSYLSQYLDKPTLKLWTSAKRVLRYLKETQNVGLNFCRNDNKSIVAFSDADWVDDVDRKSTSGGAVYFCGKTVYWFSRKQK